MLPLFLLLSQTLSLFFCSSLAQAHKILFYYNSKDGTEGALLQCVAILQEKGQKVDVIDVHGENRDPSLDNWGPPYDQVWDMRFVDRDSTLCGSGLPGAADYFDVHWRQKSVSFLNHCGKLFLAGEYYTYVDRDEGLYAFLKEISAVKEGYNSCPPSSAGNSTTSGAFFYGIKNNLGAALFYGDMVGGIPVNLLTGTSFVDTSKNWQDDEIDRSIASGWSGAQLGGGVTATLCGRGKLFMVWDATMWTLWQPGKQDFEGSENPVWDDSAWEPGNVNNSFKAKTLFQKARKVTSAFFPAVANWLGNRDCPCTEVTMTSSLPIPTETMPTPRAISTPSLPPQKPPSRSQLVAEITTNVAAPPLESSPSTVVFTNFPINLFMAFRDGAGEYQLTIWDSRGQLLQTVFQRTVSSQKETWTSWDGFDLAGREMPTGFYYAVLSKNGNRLRMIVLDRVKP